MTNTEQPMIYTSMGNMPLSDLEPLEVVWERAETWVKVRLIYRYQGEIVREEPHILILEPLQFEATAGALN